MEKRIRGEFGWDIYEGEDNKRHYADNDEVITKENFRPCSVCGKMPLEGGVDPCIGNLPGVKAACCGHGGKGHYGGDGFIMFNDNTMITFTTLNVVKFKELYTMEHNIDFNK